MSICGFDHIAKTDEQEHAVTSEGLRLMINDNKRPVYVSSIIRSFVQHGTIQDIDALLFHYETVFIYEPRLLKVLMEAICKEGRQDLLEHMVSLGFTPCNICLSNALFKKNDSMIDYLLSIKCEIDDYALCHVRDVTAATKLILHGANVNPKPGIFRHSPLRNAIEYNMIDIALLLISMNAEVNEDIVNLALKNGNAQLIEAVQFRI